MTTKPISTRVHAIIDCFFGAFIACMPWLFNFYRRGAESWVPVFIGSCIFIAFLFTGIRQVIPMRLQRKIDFAGGLLLLVSPWLFHFNQFVYLPHVIAGGVMVIVALFSHNFTPHSVGRKDTGNLPKNTNT